MQRVDLRILWCNPSFVWIHTYAYYFLVNHIHTFLKLEEVQDLAEFSELIRSDDIDFRSARWKLQTTCSINIHPLKSFSGRSVELEDVSVPLNEACTFYDNTTFFHRYNCGISQIPAQINRS